MVTIYVTLAYFMPLADNGMLKLFSLHYQ